MFMYVCVFIVCFLGCVFFFGGGGGQMLLIIKLISFLYLIKETEDK